MIARTWHGYTTTENAPAYRELLEKTVLPGIHHIEGYLGCQLLWRDLGDNEVEFMTITLWQDMEAVKRFAGGDGSHSVVPPAAMRLLKREDETSVHYETVFVK